MSNNVTRSGPTQKMIDTFLLNSVSMASDHVLNGLKDPETVEKDDFIGTMFKRGLLGQIKLREEYVGGLNEDREEDINEDRAEDQDYDRDYDWIEERDDPEQYDFWN